MNFIFIINIYLSNSDVKDPRTNTVLRTIMSHNPLSNLCLSYLGNILLLIISLKKYIRQ